ncbi:YybH family protein [Diaminobutyricibacter sp. McL0608]|uniref:YybH family protein n=1 Tax=Leifsonia sp. McL0608 TaxID=3143537 RepID=UPI0031F304F3
MTATTTTADTEIRAVLAERERAMRARDADALGELFTDDLVSFSLAPPLASEGRDVEALRAWLATFDGPIEFEITEAVIEADGDIAFARSINRLTATPKGSDTPFTLWFRSTLGLRRVDGNWLIAHDHGSTPFYMDPSTGFRAAIDLVP